MIESPIYTAVQALTPSRLLLGHFSPMHQRLPVPDVLQGILFWAITPQAASVHGKNLSTLYGKFLHMGNF